MPTLVWTCETCNRILFNKNQSNWTWKWKFLTVFYFAKKENDFWMTILSIDKCVQGEIRGQMK